MPQGYGTIKLPRNDYERHNDRRKSMGLTWAEYIDGQAPDIQTDAAVDYSEIEARCQEAVESALERPRFEELLEGRQDGGQDNE